MAEQIRMLGVKVDPTAAIDPNRPAFDTDKFLADARGGFTGEEIKACFDLVKNDEHWKNPIDKIIDRSQQELVAVAISWYTATPAEFEATDNPDKVRVTAVGYFCGPAGP